MATSPRIFQPGFRIDVIDSLVLVAGAVGVALLAQVEWWMGLIVGFAVGHFFLFCNVFRISRRLELAWGALFTAFAAATVITGDPGWLITAIAALAATVAVVVLEMRKPSYHGVFWQWLNPDLYKWWEANARSSSTA